MSARLTIVPIFWSVLMADLAAAVTVLDANGRAGVPSLLISGPGMGKSSLVRVGCGGWGVVQDGVGVVT